MKFISYFFKKQLRKEHIKLVDEAHYMSRAMMEYLAQIGKAMGDFKAMEGASLFTEMLEMTQDMRRYLVVNNNLSNTNSNELLTLYKIIQRHISDTDMGIKQGRMLFQEKFGTVSKDDFSVYEAYQKYKLAGEQYW